MARVWLLILVQLLATPARAQEAPRRVTARVGALLSRWLEAQNRGDFAAYQALYAEGFTGVRRSGAQVRQMDRDGWFKDRERMFQRPMNIQAEHIATFPKAGLQQVRFTQTFASGRYRDRGTKVMSLVPTADGGLLIAREELLASEKLPASAAPPAAGAIAVRYDCGSADPREDPRAREEFITECDAQCAADPRACAALGRLFEARHGSPPKPDLQRALGAYERGCRRVPGQIHTCEDAARLLLKRGDAERGLSLLGCADRDCEGDLYFQLLVATGQPARIRKALAHYEAVCAAGNSDPTLLDGTDACEAAADIYESGDLGKARPEKAERLRRRAQHLRRENEKVWEKCPEC